MEIAADEDLPAAEIARRIDASVADEADLIAEQLDAAADRGAARIDAAVGEHEVALNLDFAAAGCRDDGARLQRDVIAREAHDTIDVLYAARLDEAAVVHHRARQVVERLGGEGHRAGVSTQHAVVGDLGA